MQQPVMRHVGPQYEMKAGSRGRGAARLGVIALLALGTLAVGGGERAAAGSPPGSAGDRPVAGPAATRRVVDLGAVLPAPAARPAVCRSTGWAARRLRRPRPGRGNSAAGPRAHHHVAQI